MDNLQNASYFKNHLVNSYETDRNENLKFYSLFQWFTEIAWEHAKKLGLGFEELQETDKFWILSGINLKIIRLPKWQAKVKLQTWPSGQNKFFFTREFKLFSENDECLIAASSTWIIYDKKEQKPVIPEGYDFAGKSHTEKAIDSLFGKLRPRKNLVPEFKETAKHSDIDMHQHVNNAEYIRWIENCIGDIEPRRVNTLKIQYLHEVKVNDEVVIFLEKTDSNYFWEARINGDKLCFRAEVGLY